MNSIELINASCANQAVDEVVKDSKMKVLFICCGNICRSPMAEFIFKNMERYNLTNLPKLLGPSDKYHLLLDFTEKPGNIADPWYSGDFELAYSQIVKGCEGLLKKLQSR